MKSFLFSLSLILSFAAQAEIRATSIFIKPLSCESETEREKNGCPANLILIRHQDTSREMTMLPIRIHSASLKRSAPDKKLSRLKMGVHRANGVALKEILGKYLGLSIGFQLNCYGHSGSSLANRRGIAIEFSEESDLDFGLGLEYLKLVPQDSSDPRWQEIMILESKN